ncbi:MAG: AHH domain-containing protein [Myxococcales bacterium]|nr:AHH domain-containing protein [Myxococcales bacterium]
MGGTPTHSSHLPTSRGFERLLQSFGIGINDAANGVFLPATRAAPNEAGAAVHSTVHTNAYYQTVNQMLGAATTRAEAEAALGAIRSALLSAYEQGDLRAAGRGGLRVGERGPGRGLRGLPTTRRAAPGLDVEADRGPSCQSRRTPGLQALRLPLAWVRCPRHAASRGGRAGRHPRRER